MPRTFLVRRAALQIDNISSTESEEDTDKHSELHVNQNLDLAINSRKQHFEPHSSQTPSKAKVEEIVTKLQSGENLTQIEKSPRYLSKALRNALQVDALTGAIENKGQFLNISVKDDLHEPELDAEVAYHTDKSFSSVSDRQTISRTSVLSPRSIESRTPDESFYSNTTTQSIQESDRTGTTFLKLPVITPHQPLPPFASLAYNVFITSKIPMGETIQETVTMDCKPAGIIKLPLKLPNSSGDSEISSDKDNSEHDKNPSVLTPDIKNEETSTVKQDIKETKDISTKSAPKIWNPFTHVATPKSNKVLTETQVMNSPYRNTTPIPCHQLPVSVSPMNCSFAPSSLMRSISTRSPAEVISQRRSTENGSCLSVDSSIYQTIAANTFQTVPQINSSMSFSPAFSPRAPSPFVPYRPFCTPDSYQTGTSSRTSTPVSTPVSTTPKAQFNEIPMPLTGQKRSCTPSQETPKRLKIDNFPFKIYKESPSPRGYDHSVERMGFSCPITPVLVNGRSDQENLPVNRTPLSSVQQRMPLRPMSPAVLGSLLKENVPMQKDGCIKPLNGNVPQKIEVINGGFGIKNPSFVPPKPADITNIQHDESGKGSFACKVCGKEFAMQRLLNRHLKCHSEAKRYLCTFCGKGFNDTFDLKRHTRIHTGVKPYKCEQCEKAFTQRCSLESHCRKVHNLDLNYGYKQRRSKTYVCEDCGHSTTDPEIHYNHLKERHPNCPALAKPHDKRHFKFQEASRPSSGPLRPRN